jgi:hypothetical protein
MELTVLLGGVRSSGRLALAAWPCGCPGRMRRSTELIPGAFEALLARLHPDRERAGVDYVQRRARLTFLFERNRRPCADQLADEVLTRVANHQLHDHIRHLDAFIWKVAENVIYEDIREPELVSVDDSPSVQRMVDAKSADAFGSDADEAERRDLMHACLDRLPAEESSLLIEFYDGEGAEGIRGRIALARRLRIRRNALYQRVNRLRHRLRRAFETGSAGAGDHGRGWNDR